jgi:hypothetical protein
MADNIKSSTQEHLDIYTIKNHLVFLKDGSVALVLKTTAINFNLLSEEEQDATIYAYAGLLNSLSFSIQILIRSQRKNISDYLDLIDNRIQITASQKVKEQLLSYRQFVKSLVKENRVLEKKFFIIIPFSTIELGVTKSTFNPLAKFPQKPPFDLDYIEEKASMALYPRRDHIIRQFSRLGLRASQLTTPELVNLFYNIYNQSNAATATAAQTKAISGVLNNK